LILIFIGSLETFQVYGNKTDLYTNCGKPFQTFAKSCG